MTEQAFQRGDQVAYTPPHVAGNLHHSSTEFGFVMSPAGPGHYWCRFWRRGHLGELRTTANSEIAPADCLVAHDSVAPVRVDEAIGMILQQQEARPMT